MPHRYKPGAPVMPRQPLRFAPALREALGQGYSPRDLRSDLLAGVIVGVVALPLSMALAIASGVPPQYGLYTAIIAGAVTPLLGGSRVQVSGPTAAFVVILAPIAHQYGHGGLLVATLFAGVLLAAMGLMRLGKLVEFIPYPVTTGFTAGIAIVIATLQLKGFLGLTVELPEHYLEKVYALALALPTTRPADLSIGLLTLTLLVLLPRLTHRVPAPIVALPIAAVAAFAMHTLGPQYAVATIGQPLVGAAGGIPQQPPMPSPPWSFAGPDGEPLQFSLELCRALVLSAFAIAVLGAIESLLSAVVADGMSGHRHDPDAELLAQGLGNIAAPFFGGFAATGAIARTATNLRYGARSPLAAVFHAAFILAAVMVLAPLLDFLPLAALAALLLVVAWNMAEIKHVAHTLRVAPGSDVAVLLTCLLLTVVFDMVVAVSAGVVLAALLFIRRMAEISGATLMEERHPELPEALPSGVLVYQIAGPLFFGAAQKAMSALRTIEDDIRLVILDMRAVPTMDATGLVSLESALGKLHRSRVFVVIAGVQEQPLALMARAGWKHRDWLVIWRSFEDGIALARTVAISDFAPSPGRAERRAAFSASSESRTSAAGVRHDAP
jgi:SulP family sulfate permease